MFSLFLINNSFFLTVSCILFIRARYCCWMITCSCRFVSISFLTSCCWASFTSTLALASLTPLKRLSSWDTSYKIIHISSYWKLIFYLKLWVLLLTWNRNKSFLDWIHQTDLLLNSCPLLAQIVEHIKEVLSLTLGTVHLTIKLNKSKKFQFF